MTFCYSVIAFGRPIKLRIIQIFDSNFKIPDDSDGIFVRDGTSSTHFLRAMKLSQNWLKKEGQNDEGFKNLHSS
jgi:hypothetical protein